MRVLHFFKTYWPDTFGGVERTIHAIAKGTAAHGVETEVLSLSRHPGENTVEFDGHRAYKARLDFEMASTGFSLEAFSRFAELGSQADIIHYHFPWPFMDIVHFATRLDKPSIVTYHSDIVKQRLLMLGYKPLMNRFLNNVDRIVVTSPNYLESSEHLQDFRPKTAIVPIGLDRAAYPSVREDIKAGWRARLPEKFFLFVGVLRYYKGVHILLEAARMTGFPVVIVGAGPTEQDLRKQAERLNLHNVHFLGALPDEDKVALLDLCYAAVFPSHLRSEAFGLSLVEASMFAKPMISCEIGTGTSFVNADRETGLVVRPADPSALATAMQLLWNDPRQVQRMGSAALKRYEKNFTMKKMSAAYAEIYAELTAGPVRKKQR
ncbi:glycosyl transferase family 1 [Phyllobacterium phragmitis]|uniref:Glycosyl transferase family 1 n=1 Tax=Phyllobacterium phragmitis TaxID=2670329 RepID=A0A2S9IZ04_9HYPH|nr:glycosyltransferase family 4 protein [Phyllobacterium phragmitis]PRD45763.1 glycosyl transferase family 1 [Phyllobacterium phragmitis]